MASEPSTVGHSAKPWWRRITLAGAVAFAILLGAVGYAVATATYWERGPVVALGHQATTRSELVRVDPYRCADGWHSPSIGKSGACSWHGGVVGGPVFETVTVPAVAAVYGPDQFTLWYAIFRGFIWLILGGIVALVWYGMAA